MLRRAHGIRSYRSARLLGALPMFALLVCCSRPAETAKRSTISGTATVTLIDPDTGSESADMASLQVIAFEQAPGVGVRRTRTASDGRFQIEVTPGRWIVQIDRPDASGQEVQVASGEDSVVTVSHRTLARAPRVEQGIKGRASRPGEVRIYGDAGLVKQVKTAWDGSFSAELGEGWYLVRSFDLVSEPPLVSVPAGKSADVELRQAASPNVVSQTARGVVGRVYGFGGIAVDRAHVYAFRVDDGLLVGVGTTTSDGEFAIPLVGGEYRVTSSFGSVNVRVPPNGVVATEIEETQLRHH